MCYFFHVQYFVVDGAFVVTNVEHFSLSISPLRIVKRLRQSVAFIFSC